MFLVWDYLTKQAFCLIASQNLFSFSKQEIKYFFHCGQKSCVLPPFEKTSHTWVNLIRHFKGGNYVFPREKDYTDRKEAIKDNFERAKEFTHPEDWIFKKYRNLFSE